MEISTDLEIYTDGSHKNGLGSWAYVVVQNKTLITEKSSKQKNTCSNRMEFQAAIEALKTLSNPSSLTIYSDSRILIDTMNLWRSEWKSYGWIKKNGRPIPNVDLIIELDALSQNHSIQWKWIRAHAGISFNERCDELCIQARS